MSRALIVGPGGLTGAYGAGVLSVLCQNIHFDAVYASSVGVFAGTFLVSEQPETMVQTWRTLVDGNKLINFANPLRGRRILDLDYLIDLFQCQKSELNLGRVFNSPTKLIYVLTDYILRTPFYISPNRQNIFQAFKASCAVPFFYPPVAIDGGLFVDGALSDPYPIDQVLKDGHEEIIVVCNSESGDSSSLLMLVHIAAKFMAKCTSGMMKVRELEGINKNIKIIAPSSGGLLNHPFDTNHFRINKAIDLGIYDGLRFVSDYKERKLFLIFGLILDIVSK